MISTHHSLSVGCWGVSMVLLASVALEAAEPASKISAGVRVDGIWVHEIDSPHQARKTRLRVLTPATLRDGICYPVIYLLPVEANQEDRYGDGLKEVQRRGLQDRWPVIFVAPTFAQLPWYADHPTDPGIRQETYFVKTVVPFIDETYPTDARAEGRLLLGFSKSGWGAWSLLLRHPELFGRAVAWDAPVMMAAPGKYGSGPIFGTVENFEAYRLTRLLEARASDLRGSPRLLLSGYGNFRAEHTAMHSLLDRLQIAHEYRDGPSRPHDWHSGWVPDAIDWLRERHGASRR